MTSFERKLLKEIPNFKDELSTNDILKLKELYDTYLNLKDECSKLYKLTNISDEKITEYYLKVDEMLKIIDAFNVYIYKLKSEKLENEKKYYKE